MKKSTGFTLIELLAVIIILAVIALIITPVIMSVIGDSKVGAAKDSVYGYVKAIELALAEDNASNHEADGVYEVDASGNLKQGDKIIQVAYKGTKPTGSVLLSGGEVLVSNLVFDGNLYGIDRKGEAVLVQPKTYSLGTEIYFNPYTGKKCTSGEAWTSANPTRQCFKWNVITPNDNNKQTTIEMLLDHNLISEVRWTLADTNVGGPTELIKVLNEATSGWKNTLRYGNITNKAVDDYTYMVDYSGAKARIITAEEVASFTGTNWAQNSGAASIQNLESFRWLFQNLNNEQCYWTSTAHTIQPTRAWYVYYESTPKYLLSITGRGDILKGDNAGLRPVVRVLKSSIA